MIWSGLLSNIDKICNFTKGEESVIIKKRMERDYVNFIICVSDLFATTAVTSGIGPGIIYH